MFFFCVSGSASPARERRKIDQPGFQLANTGLVHFGYIYLLYYWNGHFGCWWRFCISGHGRRVHFKDGDEKAKNLEALVQKHREKQLVSF